MAIGNFKQIDASDRNIFAKAELAITNIFARDLQPQAAIETYQNLLSTSPEFKRDAYIKIAEGYKELKEFAKAVDAYKKAVGSKMGLSQVTNAELQFDLADTYELLNKKKEAVEEYFKIPYLYPSEQSWVIKAYLRAGRIFEDKGEWEQAKTAYQKIIDLKTDEAKFAQERLEWIRENKADSKK